MTTLAISNWIPAILVTVFLFISVIMILTILIQRPSGGGLSGAFGASGGGSGQSAFGARTGDALTIATIAIFVLYLGVAVGLNFAVEPPQPAQPEMVAPAGGGAAPAPAESDGGAATQEPAAADEPTTGADQDQPGEPSPAEPPAPEGEQESAPDGGGG